MTRAVFYRRCERWCGFSLEGHCDRLPAGESVLCAAVSSAVYLTANTVTDVCGCEAAIEERDGLFTLTVLSDPAACQIPLEGLWRHLKGLQEQYPRNIQLDHTEVQ